MTGLVKWSAGRKFGAFVLGLVLVGGGVANSARAAAAATRHTPPPAAGPRKALAGHKGGKLSPRLLTLSRHPRARALSLPRSGAGSLLRHGDGRLVVQIRTSDLSTATMTRLTSLGAHVVSTSSAYRIVTADVAPAALGAIAN